MMSSGEWRFLGMLTSLRVQFKLIYNLKRGLVSGGQVIALFMIYDLHKVCEIHIY